MGRHNVELVPYAVISVAPQGIVDAQGIERPADVLVLATRFQSTRGRIWPCGVLLSGALTKLLSRLSESSRRVRPRKP
jgi:hypothetical protein